MIFADSYFCIGKQHANEGKPCQDYAVTQVNGDGAIAVVSDGCSTGGKTDIGSRVVAHASLRIPEYKYLYMNLLLDPMQEWINESKKSLNLRNEDLLATSLSIFTNGKEVDSYFFGDGVFALKDDKGNIWATKYEWLNGIPFYPAYDAETFISQICNGDSSLELLAAEDYLFGSIDSTWQLIRTYSISVSQAVGGLKGPGQSLWRGKYEGDVFFCAFTDGITQIKDLDWKDAVFEFMNYKSTSGEFVKRRMMKALKTMTPMDDIACAALRITPDADK